MNLIPELEDMLSFEIRDPNNITSYGCGCNKSTANVSTGSRRVTVYEVQVNGSSVEEFDTLPAARSKAIELGGRVKVSSKVVTVQLQLDPGRKISH